MNKLPKPEQDGLMIPDVGPQSRDKHHFLWRYIDAFTTSMREKWSLHYIDLFAGAGIERYRDTHELGWGSPLLSAQAPYQFRCIHCCEANLQKCDALRNRLTKLNTDQEPQCLHGDANQRVNEIVAKINSSDTLTLAFLDPYGLHLHFSTLKALSSIRADLIIFFPDHLDAKRNWKTIYHDCPESNLDKVLGPHADWRSIFHNKPKPTWIDELRKMYESQIQKLGYKYFEYERISVKQRPLYRLIYCSKNPIGLNIWRNVARKKPNSQNTFW